MGEITDRIDNLELKDDIFKDIKYFVSGEIHDKIETLLKCGGAERINYFSDYVTHLIVGNNPEENDIADATELYEIPAVSTKWIVMCTALKRLVSTKPYIYAAKKLFTNLNFTFSNIGEDRLSLWSVITYNGGKVYNKLSSKINYLVTVDTASEKYIKADAYGIQIVTPDWVVEVVRTYNFPDASLYHPKLIDWPKPAKPQESTTSITGFEPDTVETAPESEEKPVSDSTQAMLEKLKQRMPWNQVSSSDPVGPPNVVAPSFLNKVQTTPQQAPKTPQSPIHPPPSPVPTSSYNNVIQSPQVPQQVPRSVVHHTPTSQMQQQFPQQVALNINRLIGQPQIRPQQIRNQLNQNQLHQQLLQQRVQQQNNLGQRPGDSITVQQHLLQQRQLLHSQNQQIQSQLISQSQNSNNQLVDQNQQMLNQVSQNQMTHQSQIVVSSPQTPTSQTSTQQHQLINQQQLLGQDQQQQSLSQLMNNQLINQQEHQQNSHLLNQPQQILNQQPSQSIQNQLLNQQSQNQDQQSSQNQLMGQQQQNQSQLMNQQHQNSNSQQLLGQQAQNQLSGQQQQQQSLNNQLLTQQNTNQMLNQQSSNNQILGQQSQNQLINQQQQQQQGVNSQQLLGQQNQNQLMGQQQQQNSNGQLLNQQILNQQQQLQNQLLNQQHQQQNQLIGQQMGQNQMLNQQLQQMQQLKQNQQQLMNQNQQVIGQGQPQIQLTQQSQQLIQNRLLQQQNLNSNQQIIQNQNFVQQQILQQKQQLFNQQQIVTSQQQIIQNQPNLAIQQQQFSGGQTFIQDDSKLNSNKPPQQQQQLNHSTLNQLTVQALNQQLTTQNLGQQLNQQQLNQQLNPNQQQQLSLDQQLNQSINQQTLQNLTQQQQQPPQQQQQQVIRTQFSPTNHIGPQAMLIGQQQGQQAPRQQLNQHLWAQQQQNQIHGGQQIIRQPINVVQGGSRIQWSPNQPGQAGIVHQRQLIHLDAQTHNQLQKMPPDQQALFVAKLQKQRQLQLAKQPRGSHILIRGNVPPGLTTQQQVQWLQQQAKQQGIVLPPNIQQNITPGTLTPQNVAPQGAIQHAPGLSPINQNAPLQFTDQQQQQLQLRQYRLQQLQLQREQAQKNHLAQQAAQQPSGLVRSIGQPPTADSTTNPPQMVENPMPHSVVVNAKTKTALANMLSSKLQSGNPIVSQRQDVLPEPSAAGTLRFMTAQHNAALNSKPQEIIALQQRRVISGPNGEMIKSPLSQMPLTPQSEPPKLQFNQKPPLPVQHRVGPFYGHNPNLKLPPKLFLLGCIFVVVEVEDILNKHYPGWQHKIEKYGGEVEKTYCSKVTHVLCETQRHGVVMQALRDCKRCVTIMWLSDVLVRKQVLPPWTALHLPHIYLDISPASKHLISITGFEGDDRFRVKEMIKCTGAKFTNYISKHNTLLISTKADGKKYNRAKKWGIPVVNVQWLTDLVLGNFATLNQMDHQIYQTFAKPPNMSFDPKLVPNMMLSWKAPINISQESYERVKRSASPVILPKAKKLKTEHIDENDNNISEDITNPDYKILFSQFDNDQLDAVEKLTRELGGAVAKDQKDFTHLVMPRLIRSTKLLFAISKGLPIISDKWIAESHAAKQFLPESGYSLDPDQFNRTYKVNIEKTLQCFNRDRLFEGKYFWITPSVFPSKKIVVELVQSCGGVVERIRRSGSQIEATNASSPLSYFIITAKEDLHLVADLLKNRKEKQKVVCNVEFVFSAILKQNIEVDSCAVNVM